MSNNPSQQSSGSQSYSNPLPYPDRRRPGQQGYNPPPLESSPQPTGALPYPNRPAKYSDYAKPSSPSQPQYQSDWSGYNPPPEKQEVKPAAAQPQTTPGAWPTAPTEYNDHEDDPKTRVAPGSATYGGIVSPSQQGYGSSTFAMGDVAGALPQKSSAPSQPATQYLSQPTYQSSTYPQSSPPSIPGKQPLSGPSPPAIITGQPQPQGSVPAPVNAPDDRRQSGYQPSQTVATGAVVANAAAYVYSNPQSPSGVTPPQQPYQQSGPAPSVSSPGYGQTSFNQKAPPPAGAPTTSTQTSQYGSPPAPSPSQQWYQPAQPTNPPPGQSGYASSAPQAPSSGQTGYPPPPQPPPTGQPGHSPAPTQASPPGQSGYFPPAPQSPVQPNAAQSAQSGQSAVAPVSLPQSEYMSGPPPIPGMTTTFAPPPQTYRPPQGNVQGGAPPHPGQPQQGVVKIDGKEYPIPAFTHTIQIPSQCDPVLKEEYFGPYLRFKNVDLQQNLWFGSILLVLPTASPPPRVEFHPSGDFSRLQSSPPQQIHEFANYSFVRYDIVIPIFAQEQKWTYAVTTQSTQTWELVVAGQQQQWRFIAWSCNDFSASVKKEERDKLGFSTLWKNVMERSAQEGGYHAQLGGGDQIYADRMWKEIPFLIEWLGIKGKEQRQYWPWKPEHEEIMKHAYFYYYTSAFAKPHLRDALAKIPHVFQIDDHDVFDGYGSYPHHLQQSKVFRGIGKIATEFYLLFQHHTTQQWLLQHPDPSDLLCASGVGWSFIKYFGPTTAILGLDTRLERDKRRIMSQESYDLMFDRLRQVPPSIIHCVVMLGVPIVYPRLETIEKALTGVAVAKKGVNGAFNLLGKAVTTVTPSGSATQSTHSAFDGVKKAFGKSGLMSSVVSKFGEVDLLGTSIAARELIADDLMDHWTHANHDRERTMVIRTLQEIAFNRRIRMTMLSGDVHCCGVGYLYDPKSPQDHKLMYQIITSAIVNIPPPNMVIKLLHNNDKYWVPPMNSPNSTKVQSDTKEEMMELFAKDVDGRALGNLKKLLPRRNYAICRGGDGGSEIWEICVEKGKGSDTVKYGPIVIPRLQ